MNNMVNQPVGTGVQQIGAVGQQGQVSEVVQQQPNVVQQNAQNFQPMFTQEQLNGIIQGRVNPLNQRITDLNQQLAQSQQLANSYLAELTGYKNREVAMSAGIPAHLVDFAVFEASKLAVNGKSFADAIKEFMTSNQQLFVNPQMGNQVAPMQTPNGVAPTQGVANPAQVAQQQTTQANPALGIPVQAGMNFQATAQTPTQTNGQALHQQAVAAQQSMLAAQSVMTGQANANVGMQPNTQYVPTGAIQNPAVQNPAVQVGSTVVGYAGSPVVVNTVENDVANFLKGKGVVK